MSDSVPSSRSPPEPDEVEEHHDAKLSVFQQSAISIAAPQLLNNVPHPWPVFLFLVFLHILLAVGGVTYAYSACVIDRSSGVELITYSMWKRIVQSGMFHCLRMKGKIPTVNDRRYIGAGPGSGDVIAGAVRADGAKISTQGRLRFSSRRVPSGSFRSA